MKKIVGIFSLIIILLIFSNLSFAAADELVFGVPAKKSGIEMYHAWFPIVKELENISGLSIKLNIIKDHQKLSDGMEAGEIDFGYFSPIPYVLAYQKINCEALVMRVKYGSPYYQTAFIVKKKSPIMELQKIKGLSLALTNPADSTSGYFVPKAMLKMINIDIEKDLKIIYSGKHINVLKTVIFDIADIGAIKLYILKDPANSIYADKIRIIALSNFLPGSTIAARADLNTKIKAELKKSFLDISLSEQGRKALKKMKFDGFVAAENSLYRITYKYLDTAVNGGD